jgi:hypothetical protein
MKRCVFLPLQESPLQEKSRSADADVVGMARYATLFKTDWKTSLTYFSRKKRVNFSIELSLVQYIQVILNLPFRFYEKLVEENVRL